MEELARATASSRERALWIHRPIYLHGRSTTGKTCPCGCNSKRAELKQEMPHLDVLIDRVSGVRRKRTAKNAKRFDALAATAERIDMPLRVYDEQLPVVLDRQHKVIGVFGGNRSGKSQCAAEWLVDYIVDTGGKGVKFWWVAPRREDTYIAVEKLVTGEVNDRHARPLLPPQLVRYYPKTEASKPQAIVLVDGTIIYLKYAGRKGDNLKGKTCKAIVLDEGAAVAHEINWTILLNRTMDSGGQVLTATTPVAGHWLKALADEAPGYEDLPIDPLEAAKVNRVSVTLSCQRNPWQDPLEVERMIDALGGPDDPKVKREILGLWVPEGTMLWRHWSPDKHMLEGIPREPDEYGFHNITPVAMRRIFDDGVRTDMVGGWDCNDHPQSLIVAYIVCPHNADQGNPANWHLFVSDEVVAKASIYEFSKWLGYKAARIRNLKPEWLHGLGIVGDANTCMPNTRVNRLRESADADVLRESGFHVYPPAWRDNKPANPSIRDRINMLHQLMFERRLHVHGRCRKLIEAIEGQVADHRGLPVKESATASDRLSGPADALGYLVYAVFWSSQQGSHIKW